MGQSGSKKWVERSHAILVQSVGFRCGHIVHVAVGIDWHWFYGATFMVVAFQQTVSCFKILAFVEVGQKISMGTTIQQKCTHRTHVDIVFYNGRQFTFCGSFIFFVGS